MASLTREANANVAAWRGKLLPLLVIAAVLGFAGPVMTAYETSRLLHQLADLRSKGRNLIVFQSDTPGVPGVISRSSCEALSRVTGVERAGLLIPLGALDYPQLGRATAVYGASVTLFPQLGTTDAVIGAGLPGAAQVQRLLLPDGSSATAAAGERQPDGIPANLAVVVALPVSTTSGSACFAQLETFQDARDAIPDLASQLVVTGSPVSAHRQLSEQVDVLGSFVQRPSRFFPLGLGVVGAMAAALVNRSRSGDFAAYRLSGTSKSELLIVMALEQSLIATTLAASGTLAIVLLRDHVLSPVEAVSYSMAASAAWMVVTTLAALPIVATSAAVLVKDT